MSTREEALEAALERALDLAEGKYAQPVQPAPLTLSDERIAALLPGTYYMDPPDGGDVSLYEQLRRMSEDAARWRASAVQPEPLSFSAEEVGVLTDYLTERTASLVQPVGDALNKTAGEPFDHAHPDSWRYEAKSEPAGDVRPGLAQGAEPEPALREAAKALHDAVSARAYHPGLEDLGPLVLDLRAALDVTEPFVTSPTATYKRMFEDAVSVLAEIDALLGLPDDGCNSPQATLSAIKTVLASQASEKPKPEPLVQPAPLTNERVAKIAEANGLCTILEDGEVIWFDGDATPFARALLAEAPLVQPAGDALPPIAAAQKPEGASPGRSPVVPGDLITSDAAASEPAGDVQALTTEQIETIYEREMGQPLRVQDRRAVFLIARAVEAAVRAKPPEDRAPAEGEGRQCPTGG